MFKNKNYVYGEKCVKIPAKLNFGEFILEKLWERNHEICMIDVSSDKVILCSQILQETMNLAISLSNIGVRKGDTVAICSENRYELLVAVIGSSCVGAVVTMINPGYTKDELLHVMNITKPKYIFCSPTSLENNEKTLMSLTFLQKIFLFGHKTHPKAVLYKLLVIPNENGLKKNVNYEDFDVVDVEGQSDTLFVLYSSGTTGLPKGVMLTHLNVLMACHIEVKRSTILLPLCIVPWYHVYGLLQALHLISSAAIFIFLPKFEMDLYLRTIQKYKLSIITVAPAILVALSKLDIKKYDLSSVTLITSGSAPLSSDLIKTVKAKFPNVKAITQGYGLTETTSGVIFPQDWEATGKEVSVGSVTRGAVVKVVDPETRQVLGPNQPGEICIKGGQVFKGYIGMDRSNYFDDEGFFKTGDIGYYDDEKCFFIVDRLKELIKYKGHQVAPAEIEALLINHEGVKDVGVVGVPHESGGEAPLAFVVRQPGSHVTEEKIKQFVASRLSNPKHLRGGVRFVDEIPKNHSGKILRRTLRMMATKYTSKL